MRSAYFTFFVMIFFCVACTISATKSIDNSNSFSLETGQYKIAYNVLYDPEDDDYEIFVMNSDGTEQKNISNRKGLDWLYHAYQDKIYFSSDRDTTRHTYFLYEMDVNGENIKKITDFPIEDSWVSSRYNGSELIVKPNIAIDTAFYIINLQNQQRQIIRPNLAYFHDPSFSPDGKQIVFRGAREMSVGSKGLDDELFIINEDGSGLSQLTHYPQSDSTAQWFDYKVGPPVWYVEHKISFSSRRNGSYSIFEINSDGSNLHQLTSAENSQVYHSWLRDGNTMLFEQSSNDYENYDLYMLNMISGVVTRLTADSISQQSPVFVVSYSN